ncbi:MAG: type I methionyl aminopeptidase [Burkholderiaceae bacterium]|jgi:methionyl aminopeptidase|nr:type I methionyl aminopeptidase [Burkholderiaceae bacterium]
MTITIKDEAGVAAMRAACRLAAQVLDAIAPHVKPGITTREIDRLCAQAMARQGTRSATIGYQPQGYPPYPGHVCTSVNHVVCHGIPSDKQLRRGDIVNVDVTVITPEGWYGDTSRMFEIGECSIAARRLCALTYEAMWLGIEQVRPGAHLGDIGHAIQQFIEEHGLSVVREFCGHGIGRNFHENPQVLHYGKPGAGDALEPGMIFTIEPMVNTGRREIKELADGWTIVTRDHSLSAQWEHTVAVTPTGYEVLSLSPQMPPLPGFVKSLPQPTPLPG